MAAFLYTDAKPKYIDKKMGLSPEAYTEKLFRSTTLYVGNLSFFTTECQLYEFFGRCGTLKTVIMGLNKRKMTPCGFCFVEYFTRAHAALALDTLNL